MPRQFRFDSKHTDQQIPELFPPGDKRKSIDLFELADLSGISISTLRDWVRKGRIDGAFQSALGGKWRFRREMLEKWWQELLSRYQTERERRRRY
jgi:DNA binding domain, excisionase family